MKVTIQAIDSFLQQHPGWVVVEGELVREWSFTGFKPAMEFANRIATLAESANHHPDILIRYNKVRLSLISHDLGTITGRDLRMIDRIDATEKDGF